MAVNSAHVSVATTATALTVAESDDRSGSAVAVFVPVAAAASVFVGGSGVTTGTGYELPPGASVALDLQPGESLYGVVASGTVTVHVLRSSI